jgi:hypothetical protein
MCRHRSCEQERSTAQSAVADSPWSAQMSPRSGSFSTTMNENNEPDWLVQLRKGGEAARRQIDELTQAAMEIMEIIRRDWPKTGRVPYSFWLPNAVGAAMREPVVRHVFSNDTATATDSVAVVREITGKRRSAELSRS